MGHSDILSLYSSYDSLPFRPFAGDIIEMFDQF